MAPTHIVSNFEVYDATVADAMLRLKTAAPQAIAWSSRQSAPAYAEHNVQIIRPYGGQLPANGRLIVLGASTTIGHWYRHDSFDSVALVHLQLNQEAFFHTLHRLSQAGQLPVQLFYSNHDVARLIGLPGSLLGETGQTDPA